jgi:hypothetical protein
MIGQTTEPAHKHPVLVDEFGALIISGTVGGGVSTVGTAGTPAPGVQSVQGIDGGDPITVQTQGETTNTPTQVAMTAATSTVLKTATTGRIRYTIYNPSAAVMYVRKAASAASATAFDFVIPAGGSYFSDANEWAGELRAFSTPGMTANYSESV